MPMDPIVILARREFNLRNPARPGSLMWSDSDVGFEIQSVTEHFSMYSDLHFCTKASLYTIFLCERRSSTNEQDTEDTVRAHLRCGLMRGCYPDTTEIGRPSCRICGLRMNVRVLSCKYAPERCNNHTPLLWVYLQSKAIKSEKKLSRQQMCWQTHHRYSVCIARFQFFDKLE